ncbi:MAG: BCD family MFS transporter [Pseudomonadota bacterium]
MLDFWRNVGTGFLPFADAASEQLPLTRLLRLSLFQVVVGMIAVLLTGTLNRVMVLELGVPVTLVAVMVALPFLFAPARALVGHKSDTHKSLLGWKRVPYIWFGTLTAFGGLAIMPFALLLLHSQTLGPTWAGPVAAAIAFFCTGAGIHTVQTAGLALATDIAPAETRPRVVALLYVMLLVGMFVSAITFSWLLAEFSAQRLIQVVQGAAAVTMVLNVIALWKQEARQPSQTAPDRATLSFAQSWAAYREDPRSLRLLVAVGMGTLGFSMQDVLLEPYGGEVLGLTVSQTTLLTAMFAAGTLVGFALAGRGLGKGNDPYRMAAHGTMAGIVAFTCVIFAGPLESATLFRIGTALIGFGGGLFAVGMLTACMEMADSTDDRTGSGLALGAWGAVQASAVGIGLAGGGIIRDIVAGLSNSGAFGSAFTDAALGYSVVYHLEIGILFASLIAIGPLVGWTNADIPRTEKKIGLADLPG